MEIIQGSEILIKINHFTIQYILIDYFLNIYFLSEMMLKIYQKIKIVS